MHEIYLSHVTQQNKHLPSRGKVGSGSESQSLVYKALPPPF